MWMKYENLSNSEENYVTARGNEGVKYYCSLSHVKVITDIVIYCDFIDFGVLNTIADGRYKMVFT